MKRFILYFGAFLVVFLPLVANLVHPQAVYAYSSAAVTDCKKQEAGGTAGNVKSCEQGYDGGVTKEAKKTACPDSMGQGSRDPNSLSQAQCFVGYADGYAAASAPTKPPIKPPSNPSQAAQDACNSAESGSAPAIAACEIGFDGGTNSSKDAVCAYLGTSSSRGATVGTAADCGVGWDAANGNLGDSRGTQSNTAAGQSCIAQGFSDGTGTYNACANAYIAQVAGKTEDQACNTTKYPNASNLAACKKGWEQAQTDASATTSKQLGCDAKFDNPLTWIICPVVDALTGAINAVDNLITNQLNIKTNAIFCDTSDTCKAYYAAWQSFRDIALGLMVIAGLIVVISQALGLEILDAYTIRKVLPRLLIAAIAITLSWPLMRFLINLSDDLGFGIRHLIYAPFSNLGSSLDLSFGGGVANVFFGGLATGVAPVAGIVAVQLLGGIAALLAYAGTAALAVFVAILVLILRQIAIILLMLLAPIAIVAYILPNTQRVFRVWWESFSKALLMFPLIAALIATGRVFSAIAINNGGAINQVIGFASYFAPYFLIPLTFRMAGGAVGAMGNFVQSRAQGGFQGLTKLRANSRAERQQALKAGTALQGKRWIPGSTKFAQNYNKATKGVGTGWNGRFGVGPRGRRARFDADQAAAEALMQTPGMKAVAGWNDVNRIMASANGDENRGRKALFDHLMTERGDDGKSLYTETQARERVDKAATAAKVSGGFTKAHGIAAFNNMVRDGTAIRDVDDLAILAATVGDGDRNNTFKYAAEGASTSRQVGRSDLAAASEPIGALAFAYSDHLNNKTDGTGLFTGSESLGSLSHAAWVSGAGGEVAYTKFSTAKGRTIRNDARRAVDIMKTHRKAIEAGIASPFSEKDIQFAAASLVESQNAIDNNYGKVNNRIDAAKEMAKDEGALDWYLDTKTQVSPEPTQVATNDDGTPVYATKGKPLRAVPESGPQQVATNDDGTPVYATPISIKGPEPPKPRETTNREIIKQIVGDRFSSMTPEQRKIAEQNRETENNNGP